MREPGGAVGELPLLECLKNLPFKIPPRVLGWDLKIGTPPALGVVWLLLAVTCGYFSATYLASVCGLKPLVCAASSH
jgi:hypothetical protein